MLDKYTDDCNDCKEQKYSLYIDENNLKKNWTIDNISLILYNITDLGYTKNQCNIIAEYIISSSKFKLLTADKNTVFKVLDKLISNNINASISKTTTEILK